MMPGMRIASKIIWEVIGAIFVVGLLWGAMMFKPDGDLSSQGMGAAALEVINRREAESGSTHRCLSVSVAQKAPRQFEGYCETNDAGQWRVQARDNGDKTITANWGP